MTDNDHFQKLVDAGVIPDPSVFEQADRDAINDELNDDVVKALIGIKAKIHGPGLVKSAHPKLIAF